MFTNEGNRYLPLLDSDLWTFGRSIENNFSIEQTWISRNHAMINHLTDNNFYLFDLGSSNGTFVNGNRVIFPVHLQSGDRVALGASELLFHWPAQFTDTDPGTDAANRKLITIMVADLRNIHALGKQIAEPKLCKVISNWFRTLSKMINNYGGYVDRYFSEMVVGIWVHSDHGISKKQMLMMFQLISDINQMTQYLTKKASLHKQLEINVSLHTCYGNVSKQGGKIKYQALGDGTDQAFQISNFAHNHEVDLAIGEMTYNYLADFDDLQERFIANDIPSIGLHTGFSAYTALFHDINNLS